MTPDLVEVPVWLKENPHKWNVVPLKAAFKRVKRKPDLSMGIVTAFRDGEVTLRSNRRIDGFTEAEEFDTYQTINVGDLVIHSMDAFAGCIGVSDSIGIGSPVLSVCEPIGANDPRFMSYQLRVMANCGWIEALSRSVRERTSEFRWKEAGSQKVLLPSPAEQVRIADYLDSELAEIDTLIARQQQLVALLVEREKNYIFQSVTEGLNDGCSMSDSEISWLPRIPSHWTLTRARFLCRISTGSGDTQDAVEEGEFPFYVRSDTPLTSKKYEFEGVSVLTAGDGAGVGKVFHLVDGKFMAHQRVYVLHSFKDVLPEFFYYSFKSTFALIALDGSAKSTVDSVRRPMLANLPIPLPPLGEQLQIVDKLREHIAKNSKLIEAAEATVSKLFERRESLIASVITGKRKIA